MTNSELSDKFSLLGKMMDIHGENAFKAKSYANAAFQIDRLPVQLSELPTEQIASQKGIGESTAKKVIELLDTGAMLQLNELLEKTPEGVLELLAIKGIGPKKIATIWHELGVESPGELLYACNENRLIHYKGFGEKSQQSIKEALEFYFNNQQRYLYASIEPFAAKLDMFLKSAFGEDAVKITGAFLRQCEIIDELEFIVAASDEEVLECVGAYPFFEIVNEEPGCIVLKFQEIIPVSLITCQEDTKAQTLFFTSGTTAFTDAFDSMFSGIEYDQVEDWEEETYFEQAGIPYLPPCLRENDTALFKAKEGNLPKLIEANDIKGVIHNHSTWSDGNNTIEEMALACINKGYEYLVMSDHSVTSYYANGLSVERIIQQHHEIDQLNKKLAPFKIFKSIECDILGDGRLDYDDEVLASFDIVIASVHQNLKMTEEKAMMRLLGAITHPSVRILGHPTGRLLLSRKEYPVDHIKLIEACKEHGVVIEINANPRRLDMDWRWIEAAMNAGVLLSINPDAHSLNGINDIRYGILAAQKGMLTASSNLSSFSLSEFEAFLKNK